MIIGSDANSNHPVAASRMRRAVVERGAKLIIINPRRIEMCDYADLWLRPRPGTDVALLNAMAKVIVDEGLADAKFVSDRTEDYDEWWDDGPEVRLGLRREDNRRPGRTDRASCPEPTPTHRSAAPASYGEWASHSTPWAPRTPTAF